MLERDIVKKICAWLKTQPDVWFFKTLGNPMTRAGVPDLVGCCGGRFFAWEVKTEIGVVSPIQQVEINRVRASGGHARVIRSVEEARLALNDVRGGAR